MEPESPNPLEYRDGHEDAPLRRGYRIRFIGGAIFGCAAIVFSGASVTLSNIYYTPATSPTSFQTNQFNWKEPLGCSSVWTILLLVGSVWAYRRGKEGFVPGVLCGAGITLLIEGFCFFQSWR